MNWQTQQIKVWLEHYQVPVDGLGLTDSEFKSRLIVAGYPSATARLKNAAMMELLSEVNWNELLNN